VVVVVVVSTKIEKRRMEYGSHRNGEDNVHELVIFNIPYTLVQLKTEA